jgi:hypothetical protein
MSSKLAIVGIILALLLVVGIHEITIWGVIGVLLGLILGALLLLIRFAIFLALVYAAALIFKHVFND